MAWITNGLVVCVTLGLAVAFSRPRVRKSTTWRATVTPLASIIGSGFLVIAPLLGFTVGAWSVVAMAGLVALSYSVGEAVRYNIAYVEDLAEGAGAGDGSAPSHRVDPAFHWLERAGKLVLSVSYVIAVTFYLELLGAFVLRPFGAEGNLVGQKLIATALIAFIGIFGAWRGLRLLESVETYAVEVKLSIIGGLLAAMALQNVTLATEGRWHLPDLGTTWDLDTVRKLLGAFLIAQGFETSRYLRGVYPPEVRVRTMRYAQRTSALIYLTFVGLATVDLGLFQSISETGIIDLSGRIAVSLPILLVIGAVGSQFSAAVADTIGSGGLVEEATAGRVSPRVTYAAVATLSLALLWTADIFAVIAYASRAFALYDAVQGAIAALHAWTRGRRGRAVGFTVVTLLMVLTAAAGIPAESR